MNRICLGALFILLSLPGCRRTSESIYTFGILQLNDAPHLVAVREGFLQGMEESGYKIGRDVRIITENAEGNLSVLQKNAFSLIAKKVDMMIPLSTPSLQAALHASHNIPVVFSSVANPYLAGAGNSSRKQLVHVTGVSSRGPIKQSLEFIHRIIPDARRIGTLWTPSEVNSEYYLNLLKEAAALLGLEIIDIPIFNPDEILLAAQVLVNKKIDVIYQISDNTINSSFEAVGQVAQENGIPLFGGSLFAVRSGACAALGWDFHEMGIMTAKIAVEVMKGRRPADIPIQYMERVMLHINLEAAERQGVRFPEDVLLQADLVLPKKKPESSPSEGTVPGIFP